MANDFEPSRDFVPEPTVASVINERVKLNRAAYAAVRAFRRSKAWQGAYEERLAKFTALAAGLADAYGLEPVGITFHGVENRDKPGDGLFQEETNTIHLIGKLSVVTFLHCFGRARGQTKGEAFAWSLSVFKKMFPVSFSRCNAVGLMLIR
jgi:hypothetical protein